MDCTNSSGEMSFNKLSWWIVPSSPGKMGFIKLPWWIVPIRVSIYQPFLKNVLSLVLQIFLYSAAF